MKPWKRLFALTIAVALIAAVLSSLPLAAEAVNTGRCGVDLTWTLDEAGTVTVSGTGAMYHYNSDGDPSPWSNNTSVKKVVFDYGITMIGDYAFDGCTTLISVTIPNSVITIGANAFSGCTKLASVTIPDSVTTIDNAAFYGCSALTTAKLGNYVTRIGNSAFAECYDLRSVSIPNRLAYIGYSAFYNCPYLSTSIYNDAHYIGNDSNPYLVLINVESQSISQCEIHPEAKLISPNAFSGCDSLTNLTIPDSVTFIGEHAFFGCSALQYNLYDNACYLGNDANPYHTLVKTASTDISHCQINTNTRVIGPSAFYNCDSLGDITIPDSVISISDYAFGECDSNFGVTLGSQVKTIGNYAFDGSWLNSVIFPDGLEAIGNCAFGDTELTSISVPGSVTYIGNSAFRDCYGLTEAIIPNSVTYLGGFAFAYCEELTSVTVGTGVPAIGDYTFFRCYALTDVTLGGSVSSVGSSAFSGCTALETVNYCGSPELWGNIKREQENSPLLSADIRYNYNLGSGNCGGKLTWKLDGEGTLTISGSGPMTDYAYGTAPWYSSRSAIKKVVLPNGITTIGSYAFWGCKSLSEVNIPTRVTSIGVYAFYGTSLREVTIPAAVTAIGDYAFHLCAELEGMTVAPENPNYSSDSRGVLFNKDQSILITAPGFLFGDYTVPDTVTVIASDAFRCCNYLVTVTIPESVTTVGDRAFNYCYSLIDVYYAGTRTAWTAVSIGKYNAPLLGACLHIGKYINGDMDANDILSTDDAVYLLLSVMFGTEDYPVPEGAELDFTGDGTVDTDDAVYLLLHVMFGAEDYPI